MSADGFVTVAWLAALAGWSGITIAWAALMRRAADAAFAAARAERVEAEAARGEATALWTKVRRRCAEWNEAVALAEYGARQEAMEIVVRWTQEDARR